MSTVAERAADRPAPGGAPSVRPSAPAVATGLFCGVQAAAASLVFVLVPVVLAWSVAPSTHDSWGDLVRIAMAGWLLVHRTGIALPGGHLGLVPLGLLIVPVVTCWFAGLRLARRLDPRAEDIRAGIGRARPVAPPAAALVAMTAGYAAVAVVSAAVAAMDTARPLAVQALLGSAAVAGVAGSAGACAWPAGGVRAGLRRWVRALRLPDVVLPWLRPGGAAVAVQLAAGAVAVVAAMVIGRERVVMIHQALDPGWIGGTVLVLGQLLLLPNLVLWAVSVFAGPGFAVGTATSVTAGASELGPLPAVPLLGALPVPGEHPSWAWAALAVPVLAGAVAGALLLRAAPAATWLEGCRDAAGAGLIAGLVTGALTWLSAGPAGPGRLAQVGPAGWQVMLAVTAEAAAGALVVVLCGTAARRFRG